MALATRCPHCGARFRIGADQLATQAGVVRCGACRSVFNAVGRLEYLAASDPMGADAVTGLSTPPAPQDDDPPLPTAQAMPPESGPALSEASVVADFPATSFPAAESPAAESPSAEATGGVPGGTGGAGPAPAFLRPVRQRPGWRRALGASLALALMASATLAAALVWRAPLYARVPALQAPLAGLCQLAGCRAGWPMRPDLLVIVGSDLRRIPETSLYEFDAVLRSRAEFPVAIPALELTLLDAQDQMLARRIFEPSRMRLETEAGAPAGAIAPGSDLVLHLAFELQGPAASGFRAYPFYP